MATLSVIVITKNEEGNIGPCLETVRWAQEILVLDSGSTDRTLEIARNYTKDVITVEWNGFGQTRNLGLERATGEWILWLDADERVTSEFAEEIRDVLRRNDPAVAGYAVARRAYFLGRWIKHCGWYPARVTRLFRKAGAAFTTTRVHEGVAVRGRIVHAKHDIIHLTDPDLHHYFSKFNRYTSLAAEDMRGAGRRSTAFDLFVRPPFTFMKMYLFRRGFLDGLHGFVLCVVSSAYVFVKYAKLWDLTRDRKSD
jgi:glycosyltransferase involved in cell wall biosynthesis